ncbi:MAG: radical SAM family heme chaperone HemW [Parvibaculaceae bacterium]|nr:radical SAM family heme chaperone HemW [Parvibaculaceae bacterium]
MSDEGSDRPDFGIYVHWPFCLAKCPYCDFNSHVSRNVDQARWARALARELEHAREMTGPKSVQTIFFGGGTPSLMEAETVGHVLDTIARLWHVDDHAEISLEANPTSADAGRFTGYRAAGVNRLSLGVQSLDAKDLRFLGRMHSVDEALDAIALARATFPRISFDLIYARPEQTVAAWQAELSRALDFAADHLSLYQLTIEEETSFARLYERGAFKVPDGPLSAALYEATQAICAEAGLPNYEISNHARPGAECRHNLLYWHYGDYVGAGPGAHGRLGGRDKQATRTLKAPGAWLASVEEKGHGIEAIEPISLAEQADEMMLMGLRLGEGIDPLRYASLAGAALDETRIERLTGDGLLRRLPNGRLAASPEGRLVLNAVLAELLA